MNAPHTCIVCGTGGVPGTLGPLAVYRCPECGLIWRQSFDVPLSHYEEKAVNLEENKLRDRLQNARDRVRTFRKYISLDRLIDIGCGEGIFLKALKEAGFEDVEGVEPSGSVSEFATKNALIIHRSTLAEVPTLAAQGISVLTLFHLIEHLPDPRGALTLLYKTLPKGGHLIIETPNIAAYGFRASGYRHKLIYPEHLFYFNLHNMRMLLKDIGFNVIAEGKRDFNQYHMPLNTALFRLGLIPFHEPKKPGEIKIKKEEPSAQNRPYKKFAAGLARSFLSRLVILLGRNDYLWVIAQKP